MISRLPSPGAAAEPAISCVDVERALAEKPQ